VSEKTKQICICQNFVKFLPILMILAERWQEAKIMRGVLIFHLTKFVSQH